MSEISRLDSIPQLERQEALIIGRSSGLEGKTRSLEVVLSSHLSLQMRKLRSREGKWLTSVTESAKSLRALSPGPEEVDFIGRESGSPSPPALVPGQSSSSLGPSHCCMRTTLVQFTDDIMLTGLGDQEELGILDASLRHTHTHHIWEKGREGLCYSLEADFLLLWENSFFALRTFSSLEEAHLHYGG